MWPSAKLSAIKTTHQAKEDCYWRGLRAVTHIPLNQIVDIEIQAHAERRGLFSFMYG